jgi:plastocyanin
MSTRPLSALLACLAVGLVVAGCGSSSSKTTNSTATAAKSTSTPAATASASSSGSTVTIKAAGFAFNPTSVTVKKGQKVKWVNSDPASHNITSSDGTIKSADFAQGASFTYTATKAGTFHYMCTIHPQMQATLIVQ